MPLRLSRVNRSALTLSAAFLVLPMSQAATQSSAPTDSNTFHALQWRLVGPFRGGRADAITGVTSQPNVYYAGYTGGGVWKTENAGSSWTNISDGSGMNGSIGAIAVAESDPNVVYAGTGEHPVRGQSSSYGNGVFKSTDAGRTWKQIGLESGKQIAQIRVHPTNADIVYVAVEGDRWKGTSDRGIYRSTDGGKSWSLVLKGENATSGASDLSMDPTNPRILYAAFWDHQLLPWQVRSGGPGSGIWKSTDGGDTWTRLHDGLPKLMGKIGVAVSPANPDRVYAIVEADSGGLYRSDNAGKSWQHLSGNRLIQTRSWYYMNVTADPQNADVVYVMNSPITKSIDGGRTFAVLPALHGDNHQLWINPKDDRYLANANDGGVSISVDNGKSWSTQDNQPTAQFYHVLVDDAYPFRLYSGQQDNTSVIIKSRSDGPVISERDWIEGPGCESANLATDRAHPRYVYGGCYQGMFDEMDTQTGLTRSIMPWPELGLAEPTDKVRYRFDWTPPALVSQFDPHVIYFGGNVLFRTRDRGATWDAISPDLTRNDKATQGLGGTPITNEGAGGEVYGAILHIAESPHDANTIYVATDDGLVQLTRDGGRTWTNVTPAGVGVGLANMVEVSPHDPATVYLAFRMDRHGDYAPYAFKSTNYGKSWTRITAGLRDGEPVRVIREDPVRRGLLYAGTETGVYLSFNGGATWQPFSRNLPNVPVTDLSVRHNDLYASTEGRAFWVMDDISPLREWTPSIAAEDVHLYAPRPALLAGPPSVPAAPKGAGRNPPPGATIYYSLAHVPDSSQTVQLEIVDGSGTVLQTFKRATPPALPALPAAGPVAKGDSMTAMHPIAGLNSVQWNLRADKPTSLPGHITIWGASDGYVVSPGSYQARLTVGSKTENQRFEVQQDPRIQMSPAAILARDSIARRMNARIGEIHDDLLQLRDVKTQVAAFVAHTKGTPVAAAVAAKGREIITAIDTLDPQLSTKAANGQDVINYRNGINAQYAFLLGDVEQNDVVTTPSRERFAQLEGLWAALKAQVDAVLQRDVPAFNALLQSGNVSGVIVKVKTPKVAM